MKTVHRGIRLTEVEDCLVSHIARERNASISSVVRWAINTAARQEAARLKRVNDKSDSAKVSEAGAVAL